MPSPIPKPANLRQRRNKSATNAVLPSEAESLGNDVPELPGCPAGKGEVRPAGTKKASPSQRGYGTEHQEWRLKVLALHPKCVDCGQPATEADHIVPMSKGGDPVAIDNGTGRCKPCHAAKTARDQRLHAAPTESDWHPMVLAWWDDVWRSPMASEYLEADKRGLYRLAVLEQDFWTATTPKARLAASAEIRHASMPFGLTPIDRRRLQWSIEQAEQAEQKTAARRAAKTPSKDSRNALKLA